MCAYCLTMSSLVREVQYQQDGYPNGGVEVLQLKENQKVYESLLEL